MKECNDSNDFQEIVTRALEVMKEELGDKFDPDKVNFAESQRRTGISRARLRRLKKDGFIFRPHALSGRRSSLTVLSGYTGLLDGFLKKGVSNSVVITNALQEHGYTGSQITGKNYIRDHKALLPPKRLQVEAQGNRGRRYETAPGECFQMDWGFVLVETDTGVSYRVACFAMVCHHCGAF
jgi:hypothetical protein